MHYFGSGKSKKKEKIPLTDFIVKKLSAEVQRCSSQAIDNGKIEESATEQAVENADELRASLDIERKQNETLKKDLKKTIALLNQAGAVNLSKDIHIAQLNRQIKNSQFELNNANKNELFHRFDGIFQKSELNKLRSIRAGKPADSTFVLTCVGYLYPNPETLRNKSVDGNFYRKQKKQKMTPSKVKIITEMLNERLSSEKGLDMNNASVRFNHIKNLIKNAIHKITKKTVPVESHSNCCAQNISKNTIEM